MLEDFDPDAIAAGYRNICSRMAAACARVGRTPDEVTLVAVSKTFPAVCIQVLYECGHRDFGENRAQELVQKDALLRHSGEYDDLAWHVIGHLQRNKVRDIVGIARMIHSVDSERLIAELDKRSTGAERRIEFLIQVNISGEESKFGVAPEEVSSFLERVKGFKNIVPRGLMGMPAPVSNPELVRDDFTRLRRLAWECREAGIAESDFSILSMGMSQDFEVAIEEGATHVRIGSAIFGSRLAESRP